MNNTIGNFSAKKKSQIVYWINLGVIAFFTVFLLGFFAFKTFGKTTETVTIEVENFKDRSIDEVAEFEILKSNDKYESIKGNNFTINKGEKSKIRFKLKDGFEATNDNNNFNIFVSNAESKVYGIDQEGYYNITTNAIFDDTTINISGINLKKLNISYPTIINSDGEKLDFENLKEEWKNNINYGEKLEFILNLENLDKSYRIKRVDAYSQNSKGNLETLSTEIVYLENDDAKIKIYDPKSYFGGIKNSITSINVFVEPVYDSEISSSLEESAGGSYNINFENTEGIEIYACKYENEAPEKDTPPDDKVHVENSSYSISKDEKVMLYFKLKDDYNKSSYIIKKGDETFTNVIENTEGYKKIDLGSVTENLNIKFEGIKHNVTFNFSGENIEGIEIYACKYENEAPENDTPPDDKVHVENSPYSISKDEKVMLYFKLKDDYNKSSYIIKKGDETFTNVIENTEGYKKIDLGSVTENLNIKFEGIKHNITFNFSGNSSLKGLGTLENLIDIYVYKGDLTSGQDEQSGEQQIPYLPENPDSDKTNFENILDTEKNFTYTCTPGKQVLFYIRLKEKYNQNGCKLYYKKGENVEQEIQTIQKTITDCTYSIIAKDQNMGSENDIIADENYNVNFEVGDIKLNIYTSNITYNSDNSNRVELSSIVINETENDIHDNEYYLNYGDKVTYTFTPKPGYTLNKAKYSVDAEGSKINYNEQEDKLSVEISGIKSDVNINIIEIPFKLYNLSFSVDGQGENIPEDMLTITTQEDSKIVPINSGSDFKFKIKLGKKYTTTIEKLIAKIGEKTLDDKEYKAEDESYIFTINQKDITSDIQVKIIGIEIKKLNIKFNYDDSIYYIKSEDNSMTYANNSTETVYYGNNFVFMLSLKNNQNYYLDKNRLKGLINATSGVTIDDSIGNGVYKVTIGNIEDTENGITTDNTISIRTPPSVYLDSKISLSTNNLENYVSIYKLDSSEFEDNNRISLNDNDKVDLKSNSAKNYALNILKNNYFAVELSEGSTISETPMLNFNNEIVHPITSFNGYYCQKNEQPFTPTENKFFVFKISSTDLSIDMNEPINLKIENIMQEKKKIEFILPENNTINIKTVNSPEASLDSKNTFKINYNSNVTFELKSGQNETFTNIDEKIAVKDSDGLSVYPIISNKSDTSFNLTLNSVTKDLKINLNSETKKSLLTFNSDGNCVFAETNNNKGKYTCESDISGLTSINIGDSYIFAIKGKVGFDLNKLSLKLGNDFYNYKTYTGDTISGDNKFEEVYDNFEEITKGVDRSAFRVFMIKNIKTTNLKIIANIERKTYNIKFDKVSIIGEEKTSIKYYDEDKSKDIDSLTVEHGKSAGFKVELEDKYNNSKIKVMAYNKSDDITPIEEISLISGVYKISDITQDMIIKVENLKPNDYVLNFKDSTGACFLDKDGKEEIKGLKSVYYGDKYSFKIKNNDGYSFTNSTIVQAVENDGHSKELLKNSEGIYTLENITQDYTISIENTETVKYNVTFVNTDGVTYYNADGEVISGKFKVDYGKNMEFSINLDDAYSDSAKGINVILNDNKRTNVRVQKISQNKYSIQNINEDVIIKIGNVSKNRYIIDLSKTEGIDYCNIANSVITGENLVEHGKNLSFRIKLYPAYTKENMRVMLGNQEIFPNSESVYTIENVIDTQKVTVVGIDKTKVAKMIDTINSLPSSVNDDTDLEKVINATKEYNALADYEKEKIENYSVLEKLHQNVSEKNHTYNSVTAEGLDWYIKIIANPITSDLDACGRIYKKLNTEYILALYDVYLWDTINDCKYTLPEGQSVVVHLPTPDLSYFENPTGIHENSNGKVDYLTLNIDGQQTSLEASSFSPMGIVANRSNQPGRSSLIDAVDDNLSTLTDYTLGHLSSKNKEKTHTLKNNLNANDSDEVNEDIIDEDTSIRRKDTNITPLGSALRLVLIIALITILFVIIIVLIKKIKEHMQKEKSNK